MSWLPRVEVQFKIQDAWVGAYWKRFHDVAGDPRWTYELWVCLIPFVPIYFTWRTR